MTDRLSSPWSRVAVALPVGTLKPVVFPLMALVGSVALPIIASVKLCRGEECGKWFVAGGYSLLALVGVAAFMALSATVLQSNLNVTILLYMGGTSVSVTIALYRAVRGPFSLTQS